MPRLAFEEPKGGPMNKAEPVEHTVDDLFDEGTDEQGAEESPPAERAGHQLEHGRDTVLIALKVVTVAFVLALAGVVVILTTSGGEPVAKDPIVPAIETTEVATPTKGAPPAMIVVPEVRSQTAEFKLTAPSVTVPTLPTVVPPTGGQFVRVGEACDTRGAYAFTESFEPVVCDSRRANDKLVWRHVFR